MINLKEFINENMSEDSKKRINRESSVLIKEFDAVTAISSNINTIEELEEYITDCINDGDIVSKTDMKVVLRCIGKLKDK